MIYFWSNNLINFKFFKCNNKIFKLKKQAEKAFNESEFEKAYKLYSEALIYEENDYDLIKLHLKMQNKRSTKD